MRLAVFLVMFIFPAIGLSFASDRSFPAEQSVALLNGTFPRLNTSNLEGKTLRLPEDFAGDRNLLLIAFQREQQQNMDTWLHEMKRFELSPGFQYYELPTIDRLNPFSRWFIDRGMRRGIPDRNARSRTITLYLDKSSFRKALGLPDERRIYAVLVDRSGIVLWRAEGDFDEAKASSLQRALARGDQ
jgi:hypothetical protein